jgi:Ca-activated chloride channel family protein
MPEWLSFDWFSPEILLGFLWDKPFYFYLAFGIPLLFLFRWFFRTGKGRQLNLNINSKSERGRTSFTYVRLIIPAFFIFGLLCLIIALARPQRFLAEDELISEGVNMVLALDISESMKATDLKPSRLDAAKNVAKNFLEKRKNDKIGLVVFAGEAKSVCPLTTDYDLLSEYLDKISWDMISTSGTAIGNAIAISINRLRDTPGEHKAIILISDGDNTAGNLSPNSASDLAKSFGIRIYTIAIGKDNSFEMLNEVSRNSQGEFYEATSNDSLERIFEAIDQLEKTRFADSVIKDVKDYYYIYLNWALFFFILTFILKNTFLGNALED